MPNWCNNTVEISHEDPAKIQALAQALKAGEFCQHVIPTPKELTDTVSGFMGEDQREAHEAQQKANLEKYGHTDWYSFQTSRWGTKWDVECEDAQVGGNTLTAYFDSAWSPPIGVYQELVEQGYSVRAMYYEPGMAYAGVFEDGDDDYYELGEMRSQQVRDELPSDLDDAFGISEQMEEYERENEEELTQWIREGAEERQKDES